MYASRDKSISSVIYTSYSNVKEWTQCWVLNIHVMRQIEFSLEFEV